MNERLKKLVEYTGLKNCEFAEKLGWQPPYLTKLLKGNDFGLQPVISILKAFPEIDARWFILGDGQMVADKRTATAHSGLLERVERALDLERFMPIMTDDEIQRVEAFVASGADTCFTPDEVSRLEARLKIRDDYFRTIFKTK